MQLAQFIRPWAFLSVLGLAGFTVGCGSGPNQAPSAEGAGKVVRDEQKQVHKELREQHAHDLKARRADMRRGRYRGPA
jgi:hypothetical protein